jgi:hypothetical protein
MPDQETPLDPALIKAQAKRKRLADDGTEPSVAATQDAEPGDRERVQVMRYAALDKLPKARSPRRQLGRRGKQHPA